MFRKNRIATWTCPESQLCLGLGRHASRASAPTAAFPEASLCSRLNTQSGLQPGDLPQEPREKKKNLKRRISRGHTSLFREQNKGPRQKINATSPTALTLQPSPTNRILLSSQGTVPIRACNTSQRLVTTCVCAHSRACVARVLHSIVAPRWAVN
ncbi:BQ5605_C009g05526 [Microbotryum silenes-dioicae]|uniref:BQ5605_C009g05526 protein n=1 Tax=Microbotryum silenes-dioicae TaxID=796604 RepID=A0A2X0N0C5_9BASI|nr:BQ5605_C009g05526 [Microbotryum silenes-dioicae]